MTKAKRKRLIYNLVTYALVIAAYIILQNMIGAKTISRSLKGLLVPICAWIIMAVSLNLVIGFSAGSCHCRRRHCRGHFRRTDRHSRSPASR